MTYGLLIIPFAVLTLVITTLSARRPGFRRRLRASAIALIPLLVLTAVFDNAMIAIGLVVYPAEQFSGVRIGLAPVEDFSYTVCAAFLVPAVFALLPRKETA
ncbi:lycopene cyclase domain-containing protein [Microbacterium sp. P05]|uniref:lycopene cyclase domain-containing protein n=1 Tax=Microbacterium sp. P05 TaxID=3366948 RepID=UPI0037469445